MEGSKHARSEVQNVAGLSFDIFQVEDGGVVWRGAAPTFDDASKRVRELASTSHADYIVWNRQTGDKHTIKSGYGGR